MRTTCSKKGITKNSKKKENPKGGKESEVQGVKGRVPRPGSVGKHAVGKHDRKTGGRLNSLSKE